MQHKVVDLDFLGAFNDTTESEEISYYKGNLDLPVIKTGSDFAGPDKEQIIRICKFGPASDLIVKKKNTQNQGKCDICCQTNSYQPQTSF